MNFHISSPFPLVIYLIQTILLLMHTLCSSSIKTKCYCNRDKRLNGQNRHGNTHSAKYYPLESTGSPRHMTPPQPHLPNKICRYRKEMRSLALRRWFQRWSHFTYCLTSLQKQWRWYSLAYYSEFFSNFQNNILRIYNK